MNVDLKVIRKAYKYWVDLNFSLSVDMGCRGIGLPEAIYKNLAYHALNLTKSSTLLGYAKDDNGNLIEVKGTANFHSDLTSFSPNTHFDNLIFVRMNLEEDQAYIYDLAINWQDFASFKVNKTETVADHQKQGRRPRLQLIKYIEENNIQPTKIISMR